jgi:hypothetical protein
MKIVSVRLLNAARVQPLGQLGAHIHLRPGLQDVIVSNEYGISAHYTGETKVYSTPWANVLDWTEVEDNEPKRHTTSAKDVPGKGTSK